MIHFHTTAELAQEAIEAGLTGVSVHGIEGPGWAYVVAVGRYASQEAAGALLADAIATASPSDEHGAFADAS